MSVSVSSVISVLLIEPKKSLAQRFQDILAKSFSAAPTPQVVSSLQEGLHHLGNRDVAVVLMDLVLPDSAGPDAVRILRTAAPSSAVVVFTETGDMALLLEAVQAGAHETLLNLLLSPQEFTLAIQSALIRVNPSKIPTEASPPRFPIAVSPTLLPKLAHDLNNALTSITGFTDILLARLPAEEAPHRCAEQIKDACDRATSLTKHLASLSADPP
jgi:DNA-binding NarL/FixJ family response regulator